MMEGTHPEHTTEDHMSEKEHLERLQAKVERLKAQEAKRKRERRLEKARPRIEERMQGPPERNPSDTSGAKSHSPGPIESGPELKDLEIYIPGIERKEGGGSNPENEHQKETDEHKKEVKVKRSRGPEGL
jgi:hypothetical protein